MRKDEIFLKEAEALHSLRALEEIEKNPKISQRELSNRLGVALGITNALLRTLVRKGLIKIRGDNNRSLTYHVTHTGLLAKSRLAMQWTLNTIDFYRQARQAFTDNLKILADKGIKDALFFGKGELLEIAIIVAPEVGLTIVGVIDVDWRDNEQGILGNPTMKPGQFPREQFDAIVICLENDDESLGDLQQYIKDDIILHRLI